MFKIFTVVLLVTLYWKVQESSAIKCYVCGDCEETPTSSDEKDCGSTPTHCATLITNTVAANTNKTVRSCSTKNFCDSFVDTDAVKYDCTVCDTDLCNSSIGMKFSVVGFLLISLIVTKCF